MARTKLAEEVAAAFDEEEPLVETVAAPKPPENPPKQGPKPEEKAAAVVERPADDLIEAVVVAMENLQEAVAALLDRQQELVDVLDRSASLEAFYRATVAAAKQLEEEGVENEQDH